MMLLASWEIRQAWCLVISRAVATAQAAGGCRKSKAAGGHTPREVGCPAPLWRSLEGAIVDAEAKPLKGGLLSLMGDTVRGACSPMLPSLPSSGIAESKADACMSMAWCDAAGAQSHWQ